jgi:hypothetical protein
MTMRCMFRSTFLICVFAVCVHAQDAAPTPPPATDTDPVLTHRPAATTPATKNSPNQTIPLTVPAGAAVQVVLDKEVRVEKVGQPIHGRIVEPVYAFDKIVLPVGVEVTGQITKLEGVSGGRRTLDALDADFTPPRKVEVEFNEFVLSDGRHIPFHSAVTPGSGQEIQFVTAAEADKKKTAKDTASEKATQAKEEAKREWEAAMKQVRDPGKVHKLERYALAQLPVHPQYIDAGTVYFAELQAPLDFGSEPMTPEIASSIDTPPPAGSFVHARLVTALSSAITQKGESVEAVVSKPLFDGARLILPQGSRLKGTVVQVQSARYMSRNGQLRIVFHELVLPDGIEQKVNASLEGVQAGKAQDLKLDSEGGAEANTPKTRYLSTGISVALALVSMGGDEDAGAGGNAGGNASNRMAGGAGGFKLVGMALGILVHSQPLGMAMGAYGASMSVYTHFIARGHDVVFPKNTSMEIGIGAGADPSAQPTEGVPPEEPLPFV